MPENLDWLDQAECLGLNPDIFFADKGDTKAIRVAKSICNGCVVRSECLEFALENNQSGVMGGTSERDRRNIKTERRRRGTSEAL